jgi:hypothetical protein
MKKTRSKKSCDTVPLKQPPGLELRDTINSSYAKNRGDFNDIRAPATTEKPVAATATEEKPITCKYQDQNRCLQQQDLSNIRTLTTA